MEPGPESLNEDQTRAFLTKRGVSPLEGWKPGQPLLYLLEEFVKNDTGPFNDLPRSKRPIIARLAAPTFIDLETERGTDERVVFALGNEEGARVDYYAINSVTLKPELVRTGYRKMTKDDPYYVKKENLFNADGALFPEGD